jgi:hypothetical protein
MAVSLAVCLPVLILGHVLAAVYLLHTLFISRRGSKGAVTVGGMSVRGAGPGRLVCAWLARATSRWQDIPSPS